MVDPTYALYKKDNVTFVVAPGKIIVQTYLGEYFLQPEEWYNKEDIDMIAYFINKGIIHDMKTLRSKISGRFYLEVTHKRHVWAEL